MNIIEKIKAMQASGKVSFDTNGSLLAVSELVALAESHERLLDLCRRRFEEIEHGPIKGSYHDGVWLCDCTSCQYKRAIAEAEIVSNPNI